MMKKYNSQATKWLVIPSLISIATLITGVVCVIVDITDISLRIGLISLGGLLSILFIVCCLAEGSRYLIIDDEKIDLPRGVDINGKTVLKRTVAAIDGISSIESVLRKGDRIVTKDAVFYSLRMKDGSIITFTLYAYGKNAETEIITAIRSKIDFPFRDAPNTACIVCKHVLDSRKQITFVSHDADDGMWQFLCDEPHSVDDARMISLSEALEIDGSLVQIADLPSGCQTSRKAGCNWR